MSAPLEILHRVPSSRSLSTDLPQALVDRFGRVHTSLRISVTDRCNIRCRYCMPDGDVAFMASQRWMPFASIAKLVQILSTVGIRKIRLTGGEPLTRANLHELVALIRNIAAIEELALTTNGMLLAEQAPSLFEAGLKRVNISLDTLREETFYQISRRSGLQRVLDGINTAIEVGLGVRLNAIVLRDYNFDDIIPLVEMARHRNLSIRFIEFMPLDADRSWKHEKMVSGEELRRVIRDHIGALIPVQRDDPSQPATDYGFEDGRGSVGFIDSVSQPFCDRCNRLRLTADGKLRNCLFGQEEWDVGTLLRDQAPEEQVLEVARDCVRHKFASHGISEQGFVPPKLAMYQIGG